MSYRRPNASTSDYILVRVVAPKREGKFVLKWVDRDGTPRQQSTGLPAKRSLRRAAQARADDLEKQINSTIDGPAIDWDAFCRAYWSEHLSGLAKKTRSAWLTADGRFREIVKPHLLSSIDTAKLSRFVQGLRESGVREATIDTYLRTIQVGLRWAEQVEMIEKAPKLRRPRRSRGVTKTRRGRPPTREEVERMMTVALKVRKHDGQQFADLIDDLYWSGLRIGEAVNELTWDWKGTMAVALEGRYPLLKILAEGEKGHRDRLLPIAPGYAERLRRTPPDRRRGKVYKLGLTVNTVEKVIAKIGKAAGVVVSETGKTATPQDLRRAFGNYWAPRVKPAVLQQLMRHKSIETTMAYYVQLDAESIAAELITASCPEEILTVFNQCTLAT